MILGAMLTSLASFTGLVAVATWVGFWGCAALCVASTRFKPKAAWIALGLLGPVGVAIAGGSVLLFRYRQSGDLTWE